MTRIVEGPCTICGEEHPENYPHNALGEVYRKWFLERFGRYPTWDDALEHCSADMRSAFKQTMARVKKHTEELLKATPDKVTHLSHSGEVAVISDKGSTIDRFKEITVEVCRPFGDEWVPVCKLENKALDTGHLYDGWHYRISLTHK